MTQTALEKRQQKQSADERRTKECAFCKGALEYMYAWDSFKLYQCTACTSQTALPTPTAAQLETYYQEVFYKKSSKALPERWKHRLKLVEHAFDNYLKRWRQASDKKKPKRFLDIGGGLGYYAKAAVNRGIEACLMDYSDEALAFGRQTLALDWTLQGDIQKCGEYLDEDYFDFVLARHTIEHMRNPREYVENIHRVVTAGGLLQIETPNVVSAEQFGHPQVMGLNYKTIRRSNPDISTFAAMSYAIAKSVSGVNPPKHLWGFSPQGLQKLLESSGFEVLEINTVPCGHPTFDPVFYDLYRLSTRKGLGVPYYFWQRLSSFAFAGSGMNLAILARKI
ncbi:MAG TPA: class I SAM-dependent methyltransferase [Planktothrix sp.]|jgi:2-polyprenyl-3-methyl-5-hydroxy-6-metoxy-1,4-benzoquinol methylase